VARLPGGPPATLPERVPLNLEMKLSFKYRPHARVDDRLEVFIVMQEPYSEATRAIEDTIRASPLASDVRVEYG